MSVQILKEKLINHILSNYKNIYVQWQEAYTQEKVKEFKSPNRRLHELWLLPNSEPVVEGDLIKLSLTGNYEKSAELTFKIITNGENLQMYYSCTIFNEKELNLLQYEFSNKELIFEQNYGFDMGNDPIDFGNDCFEHFWITISFDKEKE